MLLETTTHLAIPWRRSFRVVGIYSPDHAALEPYMTQEIVYGFRQNKNLKDILVSSSLKTESSVELLSDTANKCTTAKCRYCPRLDKSGNITSSSLGKRFICIWLFLFKSHNLIHCFTCQKCYQTNRRLMDWLQGHFYTVSKGTEQLGRHFNLPNHEGIKDMTI